MGIRSDAHQQFSHSKLPKPVYVNLLPFFYLFVNLCERKKSPPPALASRGLFCNVLKMD